MAIHSHSFENMTDPCENGCGQTYAEVQATRQSARRARQAIDQAVEHAKEMRRTDLAASRKDRRQWGNGR